MLLLNQPTQTQTGVSVSTLAVVLSFHLIITHYFTQYKDFKALLCAKRQSKKKKKEKIEQNVQSSLNLNVCHMLIVDIVHKIEHG